MIKHYNSREEMYTDLPKNKIGAELGVAAGINSTQLLHATKPNLLFLVDKWETYGNAPHLLTDKNLDYETYLKKIFDVEVREKKVKLCRDGSVSWLMKQKDNYLDWVYIDTSHFYEHTKIELENCLRVVKDGGYICGHDFTIHRRMWGLGVVPAVIDVIQRGNLKMTGLTNEEFPSFMCKVVK